MTHAQEKRGGAPVGFVTELDGIEAASVIYFRLWGEGPDAQTSVWNDFTATLGPDQGKRALNAFEHLCGLCAQYGRRPLMRHSVSCKCLGSDESCFANFIAAAATGEREDALLIATLLVRPDVAPLITSLASDFGLALMRMKLRAPAHMAGSEDPAFHPQPTTVH